MKKINKKKFTLLDSLILMSNKSDTINPNMVINNNKGENLS
jgi:hypothetical protein